MLIKHVLGKAVQLLANAVSGNPHDLPRGERRTGSWNHSDIEWLASKVIGVPGDFAEIGVFRGAAFRKVADLASRQRKLAHAFDSFIGMNEPSPADGNHYPKGKFDIGRPDEFIRLMSDAAVIRDQYAIWPGYVPACFARVPDDLCFSLVIFDVDHYQPTAGALDWLAERINPRGLPALGYYLPQTDLLASKAIKESLATDGGFKKVAAFNQQLILRKRAP
jgi:hypothetical protein